MVHCYVFLAVFITALTLRHTHRKHDFHREMHDVTEQVERLWAIIGLIVALPILLHGLTVTPVMRKLELVQGRDPDAPERAEIPPPGLTGPAR